MLDPAADDDAVLERLADVAGAAEMYREAVDRVHESRG